MVAAGSILGLLSPLGTVPAVAGPFLVALGAIIAAPEAGLSGRYIESWWRLTAIAAFICLAGLGVWFLSERAGIAIVIAGSLLAAYSCAFGFRPRA